MIIGDLNAHPFAPEPNPELIKVLKALDPNLGLVFLIGPGLWAITEKWGPDDPRRQRIRSGLLPENSDYDILGFSEKEMSADDALDLLLKRLRAKVTEAPAYQAMLDNVIAHNSLQKQKNAAPAREFSAEMISANEATLSGKFISRGAGFSVENGSIVGTAKIQKKGLTKSEKEAQRDWADR